MRMAKGTAEMVTVRQEIHRGGQTDEQANSEGNQTTRPGMRWPRRQGRKMRWTT